MFILYISKFEWLFHHIICKDHHGIEPDKNEVCKEVIFRKSNYKFLFNLCNLFIYNLKHLM